jgi:hypothetical protein
MIENYFFYTSQKFNTMKNILFAFLLCVLLFGCSKKDSTPSSGNNASSALLVAKWEPYQLRSFPPGTVINGSEPLLNYQFECPTIKDYCQFGSQGSFKNVFYDNRCAEDGGIGNYTKIDNTINIFKNNVLEETWEIISLTSSTLKIKYPDSGAIMVISFKKV